MISGLVAAVLLTAVGALASSTDGSPGFPRPLTEYPTPAGASIWGILAGRIKAEPFNLVATAIFALAIIHTFLAPMFLRLSHRLEQRHRERLRAEGRLASDKDQKIEVSGLAELCHFLGEVEAIFGIWAVPLLLAITAAKGWVTARDYLGNGLDFTEPLFVVVIMTIASSRPILNLAEKLTALFAAVGGNTPGAKWLSILTVGPVLGSFITEPAAMTISALLLAEHFYGRKPSPQFAYATLGLLFVNVSVGGTLTPFAAPP
ncbi:MAG TPA: putative Na+/H+ antiporter, partial [Verrucomicrobiae bacterium]|nr:putative Na+/H+ antiporter [Verrucomicrobiae bacterium]